VPRLDELLRFVNMEFHLVQLKQQVIGVCLQLLINTRVCSMDDASTQARPSCKRPSKTGAGHSRFNELACLKKTAQAYPSKTVHGSPASTTMH
jgi:type II secretory ATPase GspE/PulE/Tfp pilus assembly ATPase PilB-like protein